ncbi:response regulator [Ramlibacter humi]|uniref:Virulence sensor protein BvgS n=1 Tax=Ramlibacter humi TaxID=2530451 RepID=A0A4Z0BHB2_9BURK|nr:response regulator [Ramlibacter humi]TFY97647.1 response regulator [Ramlibacter humi]
MPQDSSAFRRILTRNVALPLGLGFLAAIVFCVVIVYLLDAFRLVEHTDRVLARAYANQKLDLSLESAARGFLLSGDERYLEDYEGTQALLSSEMQLLKEQVSDNPQQAERIAVIQSLQKEWYESAKTAFARKRTEPNYQSAGVGRGKQIKDAVRDRYDEFVNNELRLRAERTNAVNRNVTGAVALSVALMLALGALLAWRGRADLLGLSGSFESALQEQKRQSDELLEQGWLREGRNRLSDRLVREQQLEGVGHGALELLSQSIGLTVGAVYLANESGDFTRIATWGWSPEAGGTGEHLPAGRSLVAECGAQRTAMVLDEVPDGYLRVNSALGAAAPRAILLQPLQDEGRLVGVLEAGFLHAPGRRERDMAGAAGTIVGAAIDSARNRRRLQDALEETQQLNEELQVQQEELRTANEELEEQSRALKDSQAHLESQQVELEQTNVQLSEQARRLEDQRDELRVAQQELEERAAELQRASRYKSEFLANMSHELRTPLNSSLILAKLLSDNPAGNLSDEQVKFAQSIYSAGNDLLNLINDILDIAKVEAGKLEMRPEVTPIASVAQGLRSMFEPLAARKGVQLEWHLAQDLPDTLYTDRQRLEQILRNLLSNALKFTERGTVAVHVARSGNGALSFEVRDSGIGIEPSQQELIFEAFRQADGTVSRRFGGTGLGLTISRDLAKLLGGDIALHSTPGVGSTFTVVLPLEYEAGAEPVPAPTPTPRPETRVTAPPPAPAPTGAPPFADDRQAAANGRRTVLVVEDDESFAHILFDLAHELGYRCLVAYHADEGVSLAREHKPDAVLLDMQLPGDSGLSVLQRLKEDPRTRHVPVHVISVDDRTETALHLGAIGYARKPATREQLQEVFSRVESKLSQKVKRVLLVEDDQRQQESIARLIGEGDVQIVPVSRGADALEALAGSMFDVMIIDLKLPDMTGQELLRRMSSGETRSFPPVIVYTGRNLTRDEEAELRRYSRSIIIKGARSPERLLDEVTLFLHQVENTLSAEQQKMLRTARSRDRAFEGRRILVVDDDMRNIFALTSALEHKGAAVETARNGVEALEKMRAQPDAIDLVLMDIMMPEMDGYAATREIRKDPRWQKLPIIAVTAKAMKEDQQRCLDAGANDYLAKPIELERLFSLMRVWMPKMERL